MDDVEPRLRTTLVQGLRAAAATGRAEPARLDRPWPRWLAWTRAVGVGRLPFGLVLNLVLAALAVGLAAGSYSLLVTETGGNVARPTLFLCAVATTAPLLLLDRHPLGAWRFGFVAMALVDVREWLTVPYVPAGSVAMVAILFTVALRCGRDVVLGVTLLSVAGVMVKGGSATGPGATVLVLLAVLAGYVFRVRRTSRERLAEEARRHRDAEAVLTERQRIARELHDVVAHHMSMIAIQAEAAPYKVAALPDETRADLVEIRSTALDALTEMRRVLGVLRTPDGVPTAPQPGLEQLDDLVAGARGTGLEVTVTAPSDLAGLPQGLSLTAYRIAQEGLSNVMRHAPGARVDLAVLLAPSDGAGRSLTVRVANGPGAPGQRPAPSPPGPGHGLVGMRERATMLGGTLRTGPTDAGGFEVEAILPVESAS